MAVFFAFAPVAYILDAQGIRIAGHFARPVFVPYAQVRNVALRRFSGPPFAIVRLGSYPPWRFFGYCGRFKVERRPLFAGVPVDIGKSAELLPFAQGPGSVS